jgi:hypothetical protein
MVARELEVGFGAVDLTPETVDNSFRVYDPLSIRAMILRIGDVNVTFLSADLFSIESDVMELVRQELSPLSWLTLKHILPCASHIGTCPVLFQSYVNQPCEQLKYFGRQDWFASRMTEAIVRAADSMRPAQIGLGSAIVPGISYNRRSYDQDGNLVMSNFKFPYPRPELSYGPIDENVYVMRIDDLQGSPTHAAVSFGCHALCSTDKYGHVSADYPGIIRKTLTSAGVDSLFLPGSIGNVVPVSRGGRTYERVGNSVAGVALYAMEQITTSGSCGLSVNQEALNIEPFLSDRLPEAETDLLAAPPGGDGLQRFQAYVSRRTDRDKADVSYKITRVSIAGFQVLHLPGEIFVETAAAVKDAAGDCLTVILSGPSAEVGYLSPPDVHAEGGMEPQFAGLAIGAEAAIRKEACRMAGTDQPVR